MRGWASGLPAIPVLGVLLGQPTPAGAQDGDPQRGEAVFQRCYSCHAVDPAEVGLQGPNLHGVVGRAAGTLEGFEYSDALRRASRERGLVWTAAEIDRFITGPQQALPGTSMSFMGLKSARDRADVVAFLGQHPAAP